jgi:hypothetical protein
MKRTRGQNSHATVPLKGQLREILYSFIHQLTPAPVYLTTFFFEICFEFAELFKFKIRTALGATVGNKNFLLQIPGI